MDFGGAIKRPFSDFGKWVIGCLLMILPIVNFLSLGFILKSIRLSFKGKKNLPNWDNWGDLFVKGLLMFVVGLIYAIPLIILGIIFAIVVGAGIFTTILIGGAVDPAALVGMLGAMIPLAIIGGLLTLLIVYISPMAILHYAERERFGDAFKFGSVFKKAFTGKYFVRWLVGGISIVVLTSVIGWIPYLGPAVASFTGYMIAFTLVAEAY